ncbi:MAG: Cu(I)-responsive transcriptional regulator [Candidatus Dactylopiibacterium carminicum]|uniref:Cu(I)-responsive transcriptional regulator n=1 Tax=Candidatus Dactylopiibacterium carminicum TaxID=857335 RepID=A0A272EPG6_9RHOO|nr:Cu(I)-responsive transcriptional regulator [Candidatus Dactylopiibacterium carminicum]KAF7598318.1 Cu(I)-responsive transcriptional regulator [Candidatus Dactylopiibacterium carminicum]PAS92014.1 MAG: Cu(I)-responsive transcriptional regulator [Candidatus Dactylopiibacterium carminicum]PAS95437.1 MAG: Cu(I)-responsive transcriptional regulator [Candidatus Dactylopiibacterium carminicum]PAS97315.1 MAG: Cu(I)-responsive transcriptional regulator [Candidatus Dactylopiibacterium carminicum]
MNTALEHAEAQAAGFRDIGAAARASGVSVKMIRHYETLGLLGDIPRTSANYRLYGAQQVHTLRFIARSRKLGFSIEEIRGLLALWQDKQRSSAAVKRIAATHIADLQTRIAELQQMVSTLSELTDCCAGDSRPDCPILADLAGTPGPKAEA